MLPTLPIKTHHGHTCLCAPAWSDACMRSVYTRLCSSRRLPSNPNHLLEEDRDAAAGGVPEGLLGLAAEIVASETARARSSMCMGYGERRRVNRR